MTDFADIPLHELALGHIGRCVMAIGSADDGQRLVARVEPMIGSNQCREHELANLFAQSPQLMSALMRVASAGDLRSARAIARNALSNLEGWP